MYEEKRRINYYDLDFCGKLKLSAFLRMAHIAADVDAKDLGIGFAEMSPLGMSFVLQRFGLAINRLPLYDEMTAIRTWPARIERGTFLRKGIMTNEDGENLMEWASLWVLFDVANRRILRPSALPTPISGIGNCGAETETVKIDLTADWGEETAAYTHIVRHHEVDTNMHMNNCIYGDLISNAMHLRNGAASIWKNVQINYLAEVRLGEEMKIKCFNQNDTSLITGKIGERTAFSAKIGCKND
jgi:acyl-ACP thioesterase